MEPWTVRRVVAWAAKDFAERGIDSPRLDAELLVGEALSLDRVRLYMDLDRPLTGDERDAIRELVKRRRAREPIAYILGRREFYGRDFEVSPAVLVPRPDTEALVERALAVLDEPARATSDEGETPTVTVLDLCTGSGAIGLTLLAERPRLRADLTDLSADALALARRNAASLGVAARASFFEGDLFDALGPASEPRYSLIVVNPPYIAQREVPELAPEVANHEPRMALVSGESGFEVHRRLVQDAGRWLAPSGVLLVEVGFGQAPELEAMLAAAPWVRETARHEDLAHVERVVEARAV